VSREEDDVGMRKALLLLALGLAACSQGLPGSGEAYWKVWAR
jgi:hypothetical protein